MKSTSKAMVVILSIFLFQFCNSNVTSPNNSSAPSDHTVNKSGVMHKSGLTSPTSNCVSCHGTDLKGGDGPSCYSCHNKKW